jgi:excisionase family DNA binding protein
MNTKLEERRGDSPVRGQFGRILNAIPEARERLGGISRSKLYELISSGDLRVVKIGSRSFIPEESLQAFATKLGV